MDFRVGQTFGDYFITALVGDDDLGQMYKVEHSLTKRTEAMKVLSAEQASEIEILRFEREMAALARLSHPNIAAFHNTVHSENQLILLMEYVEGQTLENMFEAGRLPVDKGVGYIRQILLALGYAHRQGVVHSDVTPANVLITPGDSIKLSDFGLSKSCGYSLSSQSGEQLRSLPYLAPEQWNGDRQPDRRSDLYSVGVILYEHLTGQKPFGANRRPAPVLADSGNEPPPPSQIDPGLSPKWDVIMQRALARDPVQRYQSAEEFLDAIAQVASNLRIGAAIQEPGRTQDISVPVCGSGRDAYSWGYASRKPNCPFAHAAMAHPGADLLALPREGTIQARAWAIGCPSTGLVAV